MGYGHTLKYIAENKARKKEVEGKNRQKMHLI